jgi:hypothetical protein
VVPDVIGKHARRHKIRQQIQPNGQKAVILKELVVRNYGALERTLVLSSEKLRTETF